MLAVENLWCGYNRKPVITGANFTVERGQVAVMLGPNGAGKTTLFRTILGLLPALKGRVLVDGRPAGSGHASQGIAYVPQSHVPSFSFSVLDVVVMGRTPTMGRFATPSKSDRDRAQDVLAQLGLEHLAQRDYTQISGGERQMVLIARALAQEPSVLMMDEPAASLDLGNQALLLRTARDLAQNRGLSVLMSSHNPDHALQLAHRVVLVAGGTCSFGAPSEILNEETLSNVYGTPIRLFPTNTAREGTGPSPRLCQIVL